MAKEFKKGFVLYYDYRKHLELLTNEERGKLFLALMDYGENGKEPKLDGAALMAFSFIACQMDRDTEKYLKTCQKRSESGKKGGRPKKKTDAENEENGATESDENQEKPKKANGFSEKQTKAKKADTDKDTDKDIDTEIDILKPPIVPPLENTVQKASLQEERFSSFWKEYPKKVGKQAAVKSWDKIKPSVELFEVIMQAIADAKKSQEWTKDNGQYIPHPATWLNQGRWEDELTPAKIEERSAPKYGTNSGHNDRTESGTESTAKKTLSGFRMAGDE